MSQGSSWARRAGAAVVTVAVLLLAAGPARAARLPPGFFGMNEVAPTSSDFQRMSRGGVRTLRRNFFWANIETSPGARDWAYTDSVVAGAAGAGLRVLPVVLGTPAFLQANPYKPPLGNSYQEGLWSRFNSDLVRRYGPGGEFWSQNPSLPYLPITTWEIWNETNLHSFWGGHSDPRAFARLLALADDAIDLVDPRATVMVGGLLPRPGLGFGIGLKRYLRAFYRVRGIRDHFDVLGVHPYARSPKEVIKLLEQTRTTMRRSKDRKTPVWITEVGWATGGTGAQLFVVNQAGQAKRVRKTLRLLIKQRRRLRIAGVAWFTWRDNPSPASDEWTQYLGLFTASNEAKPAWYAFTRVTGGQP